MFFGQIKWSNWIFCWLLIFQSNQQPYKVTSGLLLLMPYVLTPKNRCDTKCFISTTLSTVSIIFPIHTRLTYAPIRGCLKLVFSYLHFRYTFQKIFVWQGKKKKSEQQYPSYLNSLRLQLLVRVLDVLQCDCIKLTLIDVCNPIIFSPLWCRYWCF